MNFNKNLNSVTLEQRLGLVDFSFTHGSGCPKEFARIKNPFAMTLSGGLLYNIYAHLDGAVRTSLQAYPLWSALKGDIL